MMAYDLGRVRENDGMPVKLNKKQELFFMLVATISPGVYGLVRAWQLHSLSDAVRSFLIFFVLGPAVAFWWVKGREADSS